MITMNLQLVSCLECPKGMDRNNCPVWQYVDEHPELFVQSVNETLITMAKPYIEATNEYAGALSKIAQLHNDCLQQEKGC